MEVTRLSWSWVGTRLGSQSVAWPCSPWLQIDLICRKAAIASHGRLASYKKWHGIVWRHLAWLFFCFWPFLSDASSLFVLCFLFVIARLLACWPACFLLLQPHPPSRPRDHGAEGCCQHSILLCFCLCLCPSADFLFALLGAGLDWITTRHDTTHDVSLCFIHARCTEEQGRQRGLGQSKARRRLRPTQSPTPAHPYWATATARERARAMGPAKLQGPRSTSRSSCSPKRQS